jgi:RNA polymerase sigma factor (sigma-70 family)
MAAVVPHPRAELERLYSEHAEQVRAICGSILRNRHEAEDAAQQVFVAALRALGGGTVPRDSGAWLATIARRESWARARRTSAMALPEELEDRGQEDPATTVVRRAEIAETWLTIADLPASQRQALLLREVRGLGYDELADDLQVSRASVRSLLNRARTTVRMQLDRGAAVFTGAEWVNVLARLFDSASSSPVLPSAGRAAAVGLGALAIAGGAVVASAPTNTHQQSERPSVHRGSSAASPRAPTVVTGDGRHGGQRGEGEALIGGEHSGSGTQTSGRDSSVDGLSSETSSSSDSGASSSTSGSDGGQVSSNSGSNDTVTTRDSSSGPTSSTSGSDGGTSSGGSSGSGGTSDSGSSGSSGTSDSSATSDTSASSSGSSDSPDGGS